MKTAGGVGLAALVPDMATAAVASESVSNCHWEATVVRLRLRHTWTTTMSSSTYRDTIHVRMRSEGVTGIGEGAPIVRYHEDAESGKKAIDALGGTLNAANPWQ